MEQYTIKDLMERYNLKTRQSIYQWCDGLNLKLHKGERNRAYATPEQVEQLDQLKEHLDKGGTIASFTPVIDIEIDTSSNLVHQSVDSTVDSPDWLEMVGAIAGAISPPNPISHWDRLYLAAERGYILSTSEVQALTGAKPRGEKWTCLGVPVCARGENRRSGWVASGEKGGMIGSDRALPERVQEGKVLSCNQASWSEVSKESHHSN